MKIDKEFYIVIDDNGMLWERAFDFKDSGDYSEKNISEIDNNDLMTLEEANKWRDELDKAITTNNYIYFTVKKVVLNVL